MSTGAQAAAVAFLVWVRLLYPAVVAPAEHSFRSVQLVSTPVPVNHQLQPLLKRNFVAHFDAPTDALKLPALHPKAPSKIIEEASAPTVELAVDKKIPLPLNSAPLIPKEAVKTNVFSTGSSATPTVAKTPSQVQTGGFGDPNGLPAKANQGRAVNVATVGSFDLPLGPGSGNGTGVAKGAPGVVASSGFGNGTANAVSRTRSGIVQSAGFTDADVPAASTVHRAADSAAAAALPAEIISKPSPVYTAEARSLRIEGEVLIEAVLQASGSLRVVRVVRGLGHGLDDNAVRAAQQIHFKPAMRDGQPADSTVVLHIVFQLA